MNNTAFIAEVSSNHNRDIDRMNKFINVASDIGCAGVKFQLFRIKELFAPEIIAVREDVKSRQAWELPKEFLPELSEFASELGLKFGCTPFYLDAVDILKPYVDFIKFPICYPLSRSFYQVCLYPNLVHLVIESMS